MDGCAGCTAAVDDLSEGLLRHLRARSTGYAVIARAPLAWAIPLYSSFGSDFTYDFNVTLDASMAPVQFNYRDPDQLRESGFEWIPVADFR